MAIQPGCRFVSAEASRAKVIDVPAHRIPAVSTTLGVEDGHHLLEADTAMAQTAGGDP